MPYIQGLGDEYNPEVVAFLMDHSSIVTIETDLRSVCKLYSYQHQAFQAFLCEQNFLDYAEC